MLEQILSILSTCVLAVSSWFTRVMDLSGMGAFYLSSVFVILTYKFLLSPIFGRSRGSDTAAQSKRDRGL